MYRVTRLPGAAGLLTELSVASIADAKCVIQSTIREFTPFSAGRQGKPCTTVAAVNVVGK